MTTDPDTLTLPSHTAPPAPVPSEKRLLRAALVVVLLAAAIILVLVMLGLFTRSADERGLLKKARAAVTQPVAVVSPRLSKAAEELVLPASVQAYVEAPIYARTHGYLKKWYFDIGEPVRKGQLLAEIDTPEEDQQLAQARADLKVAQANMELAARTAERWQGLLAKNAVSKQETDQVSSDFNAKEAAVAASGANVRRLEQLQGYEKVYAPFDGIITARQTDVGSLIDAGSSPKELFHLAAINKLRVFVLVPEVSAGAIRAGASATVTLDEFPNQVFQGQIARNASAIDPSSRTLNVEVDVDNAEGRLLPGAYGFVHLRAAGAPVSLTIPANTLIFRSQGLQVAVLRSGKAELVPIKIGHDFGDAVEVVAGLTVSDQVILDPSDSLVSGQAVQVPPAGL